MRELLTMRRLYAGYREAIVLSDISLHVAEGTALALLGRNGTGKTTLINSIMGLTRRRSGGIEFAGRDISAMRPFERAAAGLGWVPQERNIFKSLTVEENLTAIMRPGPWNLHRIYCLFPRLEERRRNLGGQLSGGEQQMLAVGRALALNPRMLLLDEPLEGLAPIIVQELIVALETVVRGDGISAIVVEQNVQKILPLTTSVIVLDRGRIALECTSAVAREDPGLIEQHLCVRETASVEIRQ